MRGVDILVQIEGPTAGTFVTVAGQRGATLTEEAETIEITSKDSGGYQEFDYGMGSWKIKGDGVYIPNEASFLALRTKMRQKKIVKIKIMEKGVVTQSGDALVTSLETEAPYDSEVTYSMEFQGTGALA